MTSAWQRFVGRLRHIPLRFEDERTATSSRFDMVVTVEPDELDGGYVAFMPDFPGCAGQGDTVEDALTNLMDAFREILTASLAEQAGHGPHSPRRSETFKVAVGC